MLYDFSVIVLTDIDGNEVPDAKLYKTIANIVWKGTQNLDLVDVAMKINRGESVDLGNSDIATIVALVKDPKCGVFAYAIKAFLDYIESVKEAGRE